MSADPDDGWYVHRMGPRRYGLTHGRTFLGVLDRDRGEFVPDANQQLDAETIERFANETRRRIDDRQRCIFDR